MTTETTTLMTTGDWRQSADYARMLTLMQTGDWAEASSELMSLLNEYPDEPELQRLLAETQLRLETEQAQKGRARRFTMPNRRVMIAGTLVFLFVALAAIALALYRGVITPSLAREQAAAQQKAIFDQGQASLSAGDYDRALAYFNQLAQLNPQYPKLDGAEAEAKRSKTLAETYDLATQQLAAGNLVDAQATLTRIQEMSPNYRDISVLMGKIERQQRVTGLMRQASDAIEAHNWDQVVLRLEEARNLVPQQDRDSLDADLFDAYLSLAQQVVDGSQGRPTEIDRALDLYNKALALKPQDTQASTARGYAQAYVNGNDAMKAGKWSDAILYLEPLYAVMPNYLQGEAARLLYNAYMRAGDDLMAAENRSSAWERYYRASQLQGIDTNTARALAASLSVYVTPTAASAGSGSGSSPLVARFPTATPEPGATPLNLLHDKIVFTSNRGGKTALWAMDSSGKNAFVLSDQSKAAAEYAKLREAEARAPDGKRGVVTTAPPDETNPQVFIAAEDGATTRLTSLNGLNSDAVWSPTGYWIAFVSNQPGNDEIFIVGADGQNLKRLTNNTFEWDKHPSWSAKGDRIVFWSNRDTGRPQIWIMNQDGSNAVNISDNGYEERDPIWIK